MNNHALAPGRLNYNMHDFSIRVYYEDTDSGGVVYYANYLKFFERARTEMLRQIGFEQSKQKRIHRSVFVVRSCSIEYLNPAKLDDLLQIGTEILSVGGASVNMLQSAKKTEVELAVAKIKLACVGLDGKVKRIPKELGERLTNLNITNCEV